MCNNTWYYYLLIFFLLVNPPISSAHSKTNKKLIRNALCYVCLAGEVNITLKQKALAVS